MSRLTVFVVLSILLSSILGLSSAQSPSTFDPLFGPNPAVSIPDGTVLVEGDIVMPEGYLHSRGAYQTWFWPGGVVFYQFAPYITDEQRGLVRAAMDELESISDVTFVPRTEELHYLYIIEDGGNWSYVGMVRGPQELSIYNWNYKYIIIHELMHALGLFHEQSRTDRDDYIEIHYENIWPGFESNFNVDPLSLTYGPYDFCSIMHYDPYDFSWTSDPVITARPGYELDGACMGNREYMTVHDQDAIAHLYSSAGEIPGDRPATALDITAGSNFELVTNPSVFGVSADEPAFRCSAYGMSVTNTVWFKITPTEERYVEFLAEGYDAVIGVYTGPVGNLYPEACADDFGLVGAEWVGLPLNAGTTYYIGVGSWAGSSGTLGFSTYNYRNLLVDSSFDWNLAKWKRTSVPAARTDDKTACGSSGIFNTLCSLRLKGGTGERTTFTQKIIPATVPGGWDYTAGDEFWFSALVKSNSAKTNVQFKAVIKFTDGTRQMHKLPPFIGTTGGYYFFDIAPVALEKSNVKNIVVKVTNKSRGGKAFVDNVVFLEAPATVTRSMWQRSAAPAKPRMSLPAVGPRGAQTSVLPVPPPAN